MGTLAADELWTGTCCNEECFADVVLFQAYRDGDFLKVHPDEGSSDVDTCVGLDMLDGDRGLEACVAGRCKGATSLGLRHDVDDVDVRDRFLLDDDGAVQVFAALGRDVDPVCAENVLESFVNCLADFGDGMAADLVPSVSLVLQPMTTMSPFLRWATSTSSAAALAASDLICSTIILSSIS